MALLRSVIFLGRADGRTLANHFLKALSNGNIPLRKMITVGRAGPNVNKTVLRILNEAVKADRGSPLLDIGYCNSHIFHNAFQAGLEEFGSRVETFSTTISTSTDGRVVGRHIVTVTQSLPKEKKTLELQNHRRHQRIKARPIQELVRCLIAS